MNIEICNDNIVLSDVNDFDLVQTFECGQCFRWEQESKYRYTGIAFGKVLTIEQKNNSIILYNTPIEDYTDIWYNYFDLNRDYSEIKQKLCCDSVMANAIEHGKGIRILQQDLWETVVSFIISASNNIPRIKKIISALCENFGTPITYGGKTYYLFPDCHSIAKLSVDDLSVIKAGFRDKYILDAARLFSDGVFDDLSSLNNADAKNKLMTIKGVGNKVADCVMLFGLHRYNRFPVDTWIKKVMEYYYFDNKMPIPYISAFAEEKFGDLAGFAQQYLFFYARESKIEGDKN